jgi:hypothetical protein
MHYTFIITKVLVTNLIRTNVLENGLKTSKLLYLAEFLQSACDCQIRKAVLMKV